MYVCVMSYSLKWITLRVEISYIKSGSLTKYRYTEHNTRKNSCIKNKVKLSSLVYNKPSDMQNIVLSFCIEEPRVFFRKMQS